MQTAKDAAGIGARIKKARESLHLSQRDFSKMLSLSSSYIAGIEVNLRPANQRLVKLIVSEFNVNKEWLQTGEGSMFAAQKSDERATRLVSLFNALPETYQDIVFGIIEVLRHANENPGGPPKNE